MKLCSTIAALITLLLCSPTLAADYREITDKGPWGDYEAFPDVCRTDDGGLIVVFYAGTGHVTHANEAKPRGGAIYGLRSDDQGKTWTEPFLIVDSEYDDRDPHVSQLANGDLIVPYFIDRFYEEDGVKKRMSDVYVVRSSDGGRTWSEPTQASTPMPDKPGVARQYYVSGPVVQLKGSHVALPIYHSASAGHYVTEVIHSEDFGQTWTRACPVDHETSTAFSYGFCEASITRLGDGRLILVARPGMHQSFSEDEGYTWSKAEQLPHRGDAPTVFRTSEGYLLIAHRHPGTSVTISTDDGKTWGRPLLVDTVGGAYAGLSELDDGSLICIYYEEGAASDIRQAIFRVEPGIHVEDLSDRWPPQPPAGTKLDLAALHAAGKLKVDTDMTEAERVKGGRPEAAFDGSIAYTNAAWKASPGPEAYYILELDQEYSLTGVGTCLKVASGANTFPQSTDVYLSVDGADWGKPVASYKDLESKRVEYAKFAPPVKARFVKVHVTKSTGWPSLNEIELYAE